MPNYNSQLQTNNSSLEEIITQLNNMPDAGGSDPILQDKTVTPTTSTQTITADSGYDGLDTVTINAMPTTTQATPNITVNSSGLITATATQTAGYVETGSKSGTKQLTTQAAKTITPSTSSQTAVTSGVYTTGAVTVAAIPSSYVKPTTTKSATTYTPTTSNQTIAAGTYCSGVQTIKGDANLVAGNIKSGVSIFGVSGSYEGSSGGSSDGGTSEETCDFTVTINPGTDSTQIPGYSNICYLNGNYTPEVHIINMQNSSSSISATVSVTKKSLVTIITFDPINNANGDAISTTGNCTVAQVGMSGVAVFAGGVPVLVNDTSSITITLA